MDDSGIWAVTYSDDQQCYHRELLSEYRNNPKHGFRAIALFETPDECSCIVGCVGGPELVNELVEAAAHFFSGLTGEGREERAALHDAAGQIEWVVAILRDVTERFQRNKALRQRLKELEAGRPPQG
jgi:hypothetical protein